ncbi:MAG: hypothetical protein NW224_12000 [Leptolyngbyaceae cyanobacterium bins.302]|nr:hypothetical protein [Leptolyngbyaceae cyanobacterium bins.302]
MLVVYFTSNSEVIQWGEAPQVGDLIPGSDQAVGHLEFYQGELHTVCFARVSDRAIYGEGTETFEVRLNAVHQIINYGWSMEGKPTTGRLVDYEPTNHETLMRAVPTRWYVDQIETCKPVEQGSYKAIYLCFCVNAPLSIAA